jgi:hypothetical protein
MQGSARMNTLPSRSYSALVGSAAAPQHYEQQQQVVSQQIAHQRAEGASSAAAFAVAAAAVAAAAAGSLLPRHGSGGSSSSSAVPLSASLSHAGAMIADALEGHSFSCIPSRQSTVALGIAQANCSTTQGVQTRQVQQHGAAAMQERLIDTMWGCAQAEQSMDMMATSHGAQGGSGMNKRHVSVEHCVPHTIVHTGKEQFPFQLRQSCHSGMTVHTGRQRDTWICLCNGCWGPGARRSCQPYSNGNNTAWKQ